MGKNILIFSDGTGQRSGQSFEETRTNIYKLYRATKAGPDSIVDPRTQHAFYDPGIGTVPPGAGFFGTVVAWMYNTICQATGLGLTGNIKDCYKEIVRVYEPGDRIFLFGFSRGAYTVRCLAAVLHYCGVPTQTRDGRPLRLNSKTLDTLATAAVERVYQHVAGEKDDVADVYVEQRKLLGERFRREHASCDAYPHFIGVFDTVAAVGSWDAILFSLAVGLMGWLVLSGLPRLLFGYGYLALLLPGVALALGALVFYLLTHLKVAFGLDGHPWWTTLHLNPLRMRFYDMALNPKVGWARHAIAIDEHRKDFNRVPWGGNNQRQVPEGQPKWLKQVWFAGVHADIGGGYPETESRLSDLALQWMVEEACSIPDGLVVDPGVLHTYPSAAGMQHDETQSWAFRFAGKLVREIKPDAPLHESVVRRFSEASVLQLYDRKPYRPENLRDHDDVRDFYASEP